MPITARWPQRALVIGALSLLVVLIAATLDHTITVSRLVDVGPFTSGRPASSDPGVASNEQLRDAFVARAYGYSLLCVLVVAGVVVAGLRASPRTRWRELFTDLGVAAVCALGLALVIVLSGPRLLDEVGKGLIWLPAALMLAAAALGSLGTRPGAARVGEAEPARGPLASHIGTIAAALGVVTLLLLAGLAAANEGAACDDASAWVGALLLAAVGTSAVVGVCGLVALTSRRWALALAAFAFGALAFFWAVAGTLGPCLS